MTKDNTQQPKIMPPKPPSPSSSAAAAADDGVIREINNNDVLCGRGGRTYHHSGNVQFRKLVDLRRQEYLDRNTKRLDKASISAEVMNAIRNMDPPGRFLKEKKDGTFFDIGDAKAIVKIGQALREGAPELRPIINGESKNTNSNSSTSSAEKKREAGALLIALADSGGSSKNNIERPSSAITSDVPTVLPLNRTISTASSNNSLGRRNGQALGSSPPARPPGPYSFAQSRGPPYNDYLPYPPLHHPSMMMHPYSRPPPGQGYATPIPPLGIKSKEGGEKEDTEELLKGQLFRLLKVLEEKEMVIHSLREQIIFKDEQIRRLTTNDTKIDANTGMASSGNGKKRKSVNDVTEPSSSSAADYSPEKNKKKDNSRKGSSSEPPESDARLQDLLRKSKDAILKHRKSIGSDGTVEHSAENLKEKLLSV